MTFIWWTLRLINQLQWDAICISALLIFCSHLISSKDHLFLKFFRVLARKFKYTTHKEKGATKYGDNRLTNQNLRGMQMVHALYSYNCLTCSFWHSDYMCIVSEINTKSSSSLPSLFLYRKVKFFSTAGDMGCYASKNVDSKASRVARWQATGIVALQDSKLKVTFPIIPHINSMLSFCWISAILFTDKLHMKFPQGFRMFVRLSFWGQNI